MLDNVDSVLTIARQAGISANKLEILPAKNAHNAWTVTEIERRWPTRADMVAINPDSGVVVDYVRFADYPFAAKLTRWGIDAHMGVLFGLPNQLILAGFGLGLCALIAWGYRLWWLRRQRPAGQPHPANTLFAALTALPLAGRVLVGCIALLLGGCLPAMGVSLLMFLLIDIVRWRRYQAIQNTDVLPHAPQ
ncbi:PepSY-associated TM helix domain-containing protein [Candidatus Symbiopectobacterium sp. 'North America']|uniref:PepSY-associated TM helix domain-containing protein n=1 Tax=Candidatus Symbiopectobacterium sp. 'North America' TaxID=2794574 RepID=UPI002455FE05|nr:PepSY-associated TM helix domain-containing protein [Candidatus Symbiopectobacterium sp. 'North America']